MGSGGKQRNGYDRRRVLRGAAVVAAMVPLLAACGDSGFRPLYGSAGIGANVETKLAQVDIQTIPGRVGQRVRNELVFQTTGGSDPTQRAYKLDVAIRESVTSTLVRLDGDARSQIYNLDATFKLIRTSDNAVVLQGNSFGHAGFERFSSIFSNVRAREDAENRAAATVAHDLKSRLAAFLAGQA